MLTLLVDEFLQRTWLELRRQGFNPDNTLAATSTCRGELCRHVVRRIERAWDDTLDLNAIGAVPTIGRSGFRMLVEHAPVEGGRRRHVFFVLPHLGVDDEGEPAPVERPGRRCAAGCRALEIALAQLNGRGEDPGPDDELQALVDALREVPTNPPTHLGDLTELAVHVARARLEALIDGELDPRTCDFAIVSGILVHHADEDRIWPRSLVSRVGGERLVHVPR